MKQLKTYICPTVKFVDVLPERGCCVYASVAPTTTEGVGDDTIDDEEGVGAAVFRKGIWDDDVEY